jgi:hypothetical protein
MSKRDKILSILFTIVGLGVCFYGLWEYNTVPNDFVGLVIGIIGFAGFFMNFRNLILFW